MNKKVFVVTDRLLQRTSSIITTRCL